VYPVKGVGNATLMDEAALREKYGVDGPGYVDLRALERDLAGRVLHADLDLYGHGPSDVQVLSK
ncbi:hypothetical protein AB0M28_39520, partial [Streptomyces sp. NPDC051940]